MPTVFGHAIFGAALASAVGARPAVAAAAALCAVAPDLDVLGLRLGIPYGASLGHRGFSHSLAFALLLGAGAALAVRATAPRGSGDRPPLGRTFALLAFAAASHGLFDALTDGGLGIAFFSPFDETRHFLPWRPIAVSPLGVARFFGERGLSVMKSELQWIGTPSLSLWLALRGARRLRRSS